MASSCLTNPPPAAENPIPLVGQAFPVAVLDVKKEECLMEAYEIKVYMWG
jgi:hypothetical protein